MQEVPEMWAQSLSWRDRLEEEMANHSNILAWEIPWTEEPDGLQSMGSRRVKHSWAFMNTHTHTHTHTEEVPRVGLQLTFARLHYTLGQKVRNKGTHTSWAPVWPQVFCVYYCVWELPFILKETDWTLRVCVTKPESDWVWTEPNSTWPTPKPFLAPFFLPD